MQGSSSSMQLYIHTFWGYNLPETKYVKEERKLQSWFDLDCSMTVMKGATL